MKADPRLLGGAALTAALIATSHWFPPSETHKPYGTVRRIVAYVIGVAAILLGLAVADHRAALKAAAIAAAGGLATGAVYGADAALNWRVREATSGRRR